jgi:ABC-type multidrug transport system fused ATPase/permease subunit
MLRSTNILCVLAILLLGPWGARAFAPSSRIRARGITVAPQTRLASSVADATPNGVNGSPAANVRGKATAEEEEYFVHGITPKTKTITGSMAFYVQFVVNRMMENREKKRLARRGRRGLKFWKKPDAAYLAAQKEKPTLTENMKRLNRMRRDVVKLAGYNSAIVIPSFTFLLLGALMTSIIPQFYSDCLQCVATLDPSRAKCVRALAGLAISSSLGALLTGLRGSMFWTAGSRANYNVRVKLHRSLLLQEAAFFDSNEVGYLLSRLNNDVNKIGMVISFHVNVVLRQFAQFVFGSIYLIKISPNLSLWAFGGISVVAWISALYGDFARHLAEKVQDRFADATAVAETSFSMSETIRAFDGVNDESNKYEGVQSKALELEEVQAWAYGSHKFVSDTLQTGLQVALLYACWLMGRRGGLPASQLTTFIFYTNFVLESSNEVGDQWAKIQGAIGASTSVFDLIRRIPKVRDPVQQALQEYRDNLENPPVESIIQMKNLTVTYGAMDVPALNGVDLDILPGDRVAIVGRSGSGKSTMLRTILRFYDPSSGSISLMGEDLTKMSRQQIAQKVSVVAQEPNLFPMSLLDNVMYGLEMDAIDEETGRPCYGKEYRERAQQCLLLAGLPIQENNALSLDLDTRVGEGGRALSGGQRQRVAIARALVRKPELLLLDEPTYVFHRISCPPVLS